MLKKAKAEAQGSRKQGGGDRGISQSGASNLSHQIWLAGLGAFAKRSSRAESRFSQGQPTWSSRAKSRKPWRRAAQHRRRQTPHWEAAKAKAKEMQTMAGGTWDKLGAGFRRSRSSRAGAARRLHILGCRCKAELKASPNLRRGGQRLAQGARRSPSAAVCAETAAKGAARSSNT